MNTTCTTVSDSKGFHAAAARVARKAPEMQTHAHRLVFPMRVQQFLHGVLLWVEFSMWKAILASEAVWHACPGGFDGKWGSAVGQSSSFGILCVSSSNQRRRCRHGQAPRTLYSVPGWYSSSGHMAACASIAAAVQPVSSSHNTGAPQCVSRTAERTEGSSVPASSALRDASFHTPSLHASAPWPEAQAAAQARAGQ